MRFPFRSRGTVSRWVEGSPLPLASLSADFCVQVAGSTGQVSCDPFAHKDLNRAAFLAEEVSSVLPESPNAGFSLSTTSFLGNSPADSRPRKMPEMQEMRYSHHRADSDRVFYNFMDFENAVHGSSLLHDDGNRMDLDTHGRYQAATSNSGLMDDPETELLLPATCDMLFSVEVTTQESRAISGSSDLVQWGEGATSSQKLRLSSWSSESTSMSEDELLSKSATPIRQSLDFSGASSHKERKAPPPSLVMHMMEDSSNVESRTGSQSCRSIGSNSITTPAAQDKSVFAKLKRELVGVSSMSHASAPSSPATRLVHETRSPLVFPSGKATTFTRLTRCQARGFLPSPSSLLEIVTIQRKSFLEMSQGLPA